MTRSNARAGIRSVFSRRSQTPIAAAAITPRIYPRRLETRNKSSQVTFEKSSNALLKFALTGRRHTISPRFFYAIQPIKSPVPTGIAVKRPSTPRCFPPTICTSVASRRRWTRSKTVRTFTHFNRHSSFLRDQSWHQ